MKDLMHEMHAGLGSGRASVTGCGRMTRGSLQRSLSQLLMNRDKDGVRAWEKDGYHHPPDHRKEKEKEGSRSFMGNVRRISMPVVSLVVVLLLVSLRCHLRHSALASASQVSLKKLSSTTTTATTSSQLLIFEGQLLYLLLLAVVLAIFVFLDYYDTRYISYLHPCHHRPEEMTNVIQI